MSDSTWFLETFQKVRTEIGKVIVGQDSIVEDVLVGLAANGHVLLEGMPGLGKTLLVKTLSESLSLDFSRLQFTPDMMPADVTGTNILVENESGGRAFDFRKGPIFSSIVLADEINRATPKTQSALLEAMQEGSVTIGGTRHPLPQPFLVMATQNPIEQEGTYPLPEAQLDRFFMKLLVANPSKEDLARVVNLTGQGTAIKPSAVATGEDVLRMRLVAREVPIAESVLNFGLSIIVGTRPTGLGSTSVSQRFCRYGCSPRGAQSLVIAAKVYALLAGRFNVSKEDLIRAAKPTLRHRIGLNYEAEAEGMTTDRVIDEIVAAVVAEDRDPIRV